MALVILVLGTVAFASSWGGQYIWDDGPWLVENGAVQGGWKGLVQIWTDPIATPHYYPLVFTTFWLEYNTWQLYPVGYRAVNSVLHALGALILWRVLRRLGLRWAWLAALVWALHPVQVETVAWVAERKNVLSGVFFWGSVWAYLRFAGISTPDAQPSAPPRSQPIRWYVLALALFCLAMLSKTVVCVLPAVLIVILWWKRPALHWRDLLPTAPFFVIGLGLAAVSVTIEHGQVGTSGPEWAYTLVQRAVIAGNAVWFYAGKLLWPEPLVAIYPRWWGYGLPADIVFTARDWVGPIAVPVTLALLWLLRGRVSKAPAAALACFVIILSPALGFISFYTTLYTYVCDHYQYLACAALLAFFVEIAGMAWRWISGQLTAASAARGAKPSRVFIWAGPGLAGALVFALTWQTFWQAHLYWRTGDLWRYCLEYNPNCYAAVSNYGSALANMGRIDECIPYFERARDLAPNDFEVYQNLASIFASRGDIDQAAAYDAKAQALKPAMQRDIEQHLLGSATQRGPLPADAIQAVRTGDAQMAAGDAAAAEQTFALALKAHRDRPELWLRLSGAWRSQGKTKEASMALEQARKLDPTGHGMMLQLQLSK